MPDEETFIREEECVTIELDIDNDVLKKLQDLSLRTGFSTDKLVEYILAEQIIKQALQS